MVSQRRLVAFLLLTSVSLAALIPLSGMGLLWAICAPVLIIFAFVVIFTTFVELEDLAFPAQAHLCASGSRAPPLA
jgi:ABC-type polysaccharide/polyol phosphate export permease